MLLQARGARVPALAVVVGGVVTIAIGVVPSAQFAYENASLHVALDAFEGTVAALLAYLGIGRFRASRQLRDAAMASAFAVFAVTNLLLSAVPGAAMQDRPSGFLVWLVLGARLVGALAFCGAATLRDRVLAPSPGTATRLAAACAVAVGVVVIGAVAAERGLEVGVDVTLSASSSRVPVLAGHPVLLGAQAMSAVLYGVAAVSFLRRARRSGDDVLVLLSAGAVLAAWARVNFLLFPSIYSRWVYSGDLLRLGAYLLFLVAAAREIRGYWHRLAEAAVLEERRRFARDLHDGLTQELAFIRSQTSALAVQPGRPAVLSHLADAADRALTESRKLVAALADPTPAVSIAPALWRAGQDVAQRAGARVSVDVPPRLEVPAPIVDAFAGIVREAINNAVRHGAARSVAVTVERDGDRLRLRVRDDGRGFEPSATKPSEGGGFGLTSMRQRAEAVGGAFDLDTGPGRGCVVEVVVPHHRVTRV